MGKSMDVRGGPGRITGALMGSGEAVAVRDCFLARGVMWWDLMLSRVAVAVL